MRELYYPKIPDSKDCPLEQCIAFEKYDGTNLHWTWNGVWTGFGPRRRHIRSLKKVLMVGDAVCKDAAAGSLESLLREAVNAHSYQIR
jgi:hypothetical protein